MAEAARLFPVDEDASEDAGQAGRPAELLEGVRIAEALVFAAESPMDETDIAKRLPEGVKIADVMQELRGHYEGRGVNLVRVGRKWTFRTAADLGWLLSRDVQQQKKLSRAALETLAIIAYHQPTTRAEIEDIRGVAISKGTLDVLLETGWVRLRGRRKAPGRPVTYGTTDDFLLHFGLESISDLPGLDELKGAGLFDGRLPPGFGVPTPNDSAELAEDEDPLEDGDLLALAREDEEAANAAAALELAAVEAEAEAAVEDVLEAEAEAADLIERIETGPDAEPSAATPEEVEDPVSGEQSGSDEDAREAAATLGVAQDEDPQAGAEDETPAAPAQDDILVPPKPAND